MVWCLVSLLLRLYPALSSQRKISNVYILLPQTKHVVNERYVHYELQAYNGCYRWSTPDSQLLLIKEDQLGTMDYFQTPNGNYEQNHNNSDQLCYYSAIVNPIAAMRNPPGTVIYATEQYYQERLKCEVQISQIFKIDVQRTIQSFRVGNYQKLYLRAEDALGNTFTSLEGLRFRWNIVSGGHALGMPKTRESLISLTQPRREIEASGYHSDVILVEGKATGVANVTAVIEEPGYENVPLAWTLIYVSEPFGLIPSAIIYLPPRAVYEFKLYKMQDQQWVKQNLPNGGYIWSSASSDLFELRESGEIYTLDRLGVGNFDVKDALIEQNSASCQVRVVGPDRIFISIEEYSEQEQESRLSEDEFFKLSQPDKLFPSNWYLIEGKKYKIKLRLFSKDQEVAIPSNGEFQISFDEYQYWTVIKTSQNGAEMIVMPRLLEGQNTVKSKIKGDLIKIRAKLHFLQDWIPMPAIQNTEEAIIIKQIKIIEHKVPILLPYFGVLSQTPTKEGKVAQDYTIQTEGGSGALQFSSTHPDIASTNQSGRVFAHKLGKVIVQVTDLNNEQNFDTVEVEVALVDQLAWKVPRLEITHGYSKVSEIQGLASGGRFFHNCTAIALEWENQDRTVNISQKLMITEDQKRQGVCDSRKLSSNQVGQSLLQAQLHGVPQVLSPNSPETQVNAPLGRVSVFKPLSFGLIEEYKVEGSSETFTQIDESNAIIITPNTQAEITLSGGPNQWDDLKGDFVQQIEGNNYTKVNLVPDKLNGYALQISCSYNTDNEKFIIKQYNKSSNLLQQPGYSEINFVVSCMDPFSAQIEWVLNRRQLTNIDTKSIPVEYNQYKHSIASKFSQFWIILNDQQQKLQVKMFDDKKRQFYDFSQAQLEWSSNNEEVLKLESQDQYDQQTVRLSKSEGPVTVYLKATQYKNGKSMYSEVNAQLNNEIVRAVEIDPKQFSLYLHLDNSAQLNIKYGSGSFQLREVDQSVATVHYDGYRKIMVRPIKTGNLRVIIEDIGLQGIADSEILVSGLIGLDLKENQLVELGKNASLQVKAIDSAGRYFTADQVPWMDIRLNMGKQKSLKLQQSTFKDIFILACTQIGEFPISAFGNSQYNSHDKSQPTINSNSVVIDVFPPVQILPKTIILLPNTEYGLNYIGGPALQKYPIYNISLQWQVQEDRIATLKQDTSIVQTNEIGTTPISLTLFKDRDYLTGDQGEIKVQLATGLAIQGMEPGRSVIKDSITRVIAILQYNGEPFTDAIGNIDYIWSVSNPSVYHFHHNELQENHQIAMTGHALSIGQSDIALTATVAYPEKYASNNNVFNSRSVVVVEPGLHAETPSHRCHSLQNQDCGDEFSKWRDSMQIIMPPQSSYTLKFNKEGQFTFTCEHCREDFLDLEENGTLIARGNQGQAAVFVRNSKSKADYHSVNVVIQDIYSVIIEDSHQVRNMALGSELQLKVTYQDTMARSLHRDFNYGINARVEVSNSMVLQAQLTNRNSTLSIQTKYTGKTYVKVFMIDNPRIKDIFEVNVSSVMRPLSPLVLVLGGTATFKTTHGGAGGKWSVENDRLLQIDSYGSIEAINTGQTKVHYKEKSLDLSSKVIIEQIQGVSLDKEGPKEVTNYEYHPQYKDQYKIPLRFYIDQQKTNQVVLLKDDDKHLVNHKMQVQCSLPTQSNLFRVESISTGNPDSYCILYPLKNTDLSQSKELVLQVTVTSSKFNLYTYQEQLLIPLLPKYAIGGAGHQVNLTPYEPTADVPIQGGSCDRFSIHIDTSLVIGHLVDKDGQCFVKVVALDKNEDFRYKRIELVDKSTGQKEIILVNFYKDPANIRAQPVLSIHDMIIGIALFVLVYLIYMYYKGSRQYPSQPPIRPIGLPNNPIPRIGRANPEDRYLRT